VDAAGRIAWDVALTQGMQRSDVARGLLYSAEGRQDLVDALYLEYLRRSADPLGQQGFVSALQSGTPEQQVVAGLVGSPEYFNRWM